MNKSELVSVMAEKAGLTKKDSEAALDAFVAAVSEALANGEKVQLVGFGSFEVTERPERVGRNPQNGEKIQIAASKAPKFKAGKSLKEQVK